MGRALADDSDEIHGGFAELRLAAAGHVGEPGVERGTGVRQPGGVGGGVVERVGIVIPRVADETHDAAEFEVVAGAGPGDVVREGVGGRFADIGARVAGGWFQVTEVDEGFLRQAGVFEAGASEAVAEGVDERVSQYRVPTDGEATGVIEAGVIRRLAGELGDFIFVIVLQVAADEEGVFAGFVENGVELRHVGLPVEADGGVEAEAGGIKSVAGAGIVG